ncbi:MULTISPECIES: IS3 family transposase [unclassified Streptomyces]|uniref:IS3 family transposase n=1 Tax=unclassified Streptomyces TaxID=2593676 RepID=UPI000F4ADFA7
MSPRSPCGGRRTGSRRAFGDPRAQAGERRTADGLGVFRGAARPDPAQVAALLDEHPYLGVECVLRELSIAPSAYYRWRHAEKEPCERRRRDVELTEQIKEIHTGSDGVHGSRRVHAMLKREGVHVSRKRVERLMREAVLAGLSPRHKGFTRRDPKPHSPRTSSTGTSPPRGRTGCGSPDCGLKTRARPETAASLANLAAAARTVRGERGSAHARMRRQLGSHAPPFGWRGMG